MNDITESSAPRVGSSALFGILERCEQAGVSKVFAANHHGMGFLLSAGPEQTNGIVYRNDGLPHSDMTQLAEEVNTALMPNR